MVGDDKNMTAVEVEALKMRVDSIEKQNEKQFTKIENSLDKVWTKIDEYRNGQIVTQTIVESIRKDMNDGRIENAKVFDKLNDKLDGLKSDMNKADIQRVQAESKNNDKNQSEWKNFFKKLAYGAGGLLVAIILYKLGLFPSK